MTPADPYDACRFAHAALTGLLTVEGFRVDAYLRAHVLELPEDERGSFLASAVMAAIYSHAGTMFALAQHGADVPALLAACGEAQTRAQGSS